MIAMFGFYIAISYAYFFSVETSLKQCGLELFVCLNTIAPIGR